MKFKHQMINLTNSFNTNFGFNDKSRDFLKKVTRGNAENQYPTEDMMRIKAYMLSLQEDITAS